MSMCNESFGNRILELLNYPLIDRCPELGILFDRCSIRELQEVFPSIINSIFGINSGSLGWGLRTITKETAPQIFDILANFFTPLGPMFRLCYRLLNDSYKFEMSIDFLPKKMNEMFMSGNYPVFYADLIQTDPYLRTVSSLSLNAFDYFILNFVIHGTFPLHRVYPAALQVHNELAKTIYFILAAEYMSFFLSNVPDPVILPTNICGAVKASQSVPVQPLQPTRLPKYLKLSPVSHFGSPSSSPTSLNQSNPHTPESPRAHAWRTESVLYFFVDTWTRLNVEEMRDLPSTEFVRGVRILVKQIHSFGSVAEVDNTSMAKLRKLALPMLKVRIYPFLKALIGRWPLDSSLLIVLELWLSYIQPWRYYYMNTTRLSEIPIIRYESFISENLVVYTQIFVEVFQRFQRLDFTSYKNVTMLHRIAKVFNQQDLPRILRMTEERLISPTTSSSSAATGGAGSFSHQTSSFSRCYNRQNQTIDNTISTTYESFRNDLTFPNDENYIPMFGDAVRNGIKQFIKYIYITKTYVIQDIENKSISLGNHKRGLSLIKSIFVSLFEDITLLTNKLNELVKVPNMLEISIQSFSYIFDINLSEISIDYIEPREISYADLDLSLERELDIRKLSPIQMKNKAANLRPNIDPALLPIQSYECFFLVRFLHQLSCKINLMFQNEIFYYWHRNDFVGKFVKQILYPPMTTEWFDKSKGISELREEYLPPRVSLRVFASYKVLFLIGCSMLFGHLLWGIPSFGLFLLLVLTLIYLLVRTLLPIN